MRDTEQEGKGEKDAQDGMKKAGQTQSRNPGYQRCPVPSLCWNAQTDVQIMCVAWIDDGTMGRMDDGTNGQWMNG